MKRVEVTIVPEAGDRWYGEIYVDDEFYADVHAPSYFDIVVGVSGYMQLRGFRREEV